MQCADGLTTARTLGELCGVSAGHTGAYARQILRELDYRIVKIVYQM
jgi:hypothetical protein